MQWTGVISLRPALGMGRTLRDVTGADPDAVYGCVDWFLYHETPFTTCSSPGEPAAVSESARPSGATGAETGARPSG